MILAQNFSGCLKFLAVFSVVCIGALLYTRVSVRPTTDDEPKRQDIQYDYERNIEDDNNIKDNEMARQDFWNWSYNKKSKFQKESVKDYCKAHSISGTDLPSLRILLHKEKEVAFCYIPKSACTTFKILFLHTQGLLTDEFLDYKTQMQPRINSAVKKISLKSVDERKRKSTLQHYFKFVMFRHPLERLLSGYRNKMSVAMRQNVPDAEREIQTNLFLKEKEEIISEINPKQYKKWMAKHQSYPVNITFSDFINYWLNSKTLSNNPHFNTLVKNCNPCSVNYDYFGNFKSFKEDTNILLERIGASEDEVRPQYPESSDKVFNKYYSRLSDAQKIKVVKKLSPDLELYYMLFPPETDSHKQMLQIDYDL